MKRLKSLVIEAASTVTHRLISVRSSIPVLILAILGCGSSALFSQQGHDRVPSAVISEPEVQKAAVGKHLFILSGQSNMVGLDPNITFTPNVTAALGKDAVIVVKDAPEGYRLLGKRFADKAIAQITGKTNGP